MGWNVSIAVHCTLRRGGRVGVVDGACACAARDRRANRERAAKGRRIQIEVRRRAVYVSTSDLIYFFSLRPPTSSIIYSYTFYTFFPLPNFACCFKYTKCEEIVKKDREECAFAIALHLLIIFYLFNIYLIYPKYFILINLLLYYIFVTSLSRLFLQQSRSYLLNDERIT